MPSPSYDREASESPIFAILVSEAHAWAGPGPSGIQYSPIPCITRYMLDSEAYISVVDGVRNDTASNTPDSRLTAVIMVRVSAG